MKKIYFILTTLCIALFAASCTKDDADSVQNGYLKLEALNIATATKAVAPADYNAKVIEVNIKKKTSGAVVKTLTIDCNSATDAQVIELAPGTYDIEAHSKNWDGSDSGIGTPYYVGSVEDVKIKSETKTSASLTLKLANVKVTVEFPETFSTYFKKAEATVFSLLNTVTADQKFTMGAASASQVAYFPAGTLRVKLDVTDMEDGINTKTMEIADVKAQEWVKISFVLDGGAQSSISIVIDKEGKTYKIPFNVPILDEVRVPDAITLNSINAFSDKVVVESTVDGKFFPAKMYVETKEKTAGATWTRATATKNVSGQNVAFTVTGLAQNTPYDCRVVYDGTDVATDARAFQSLYNGGFESWWLDNNVYYANESSNVSYWDSSNKGSAIAVGSVTTPEQSIKRGGIYAAKLAASSAFGKLAAGSLFIGKFQKLIGINGAMLDWGAPFTLRPKSLKGYMNFAPGTINFASNSVPSDAPAKNATDECQIFCALLSQQMHVGGNATGSNNGIDYEKSTLLNWSTDSRVVAYGQMTSNTSTNGNWQEFNIPLTYNSSDTPAYILVVASSCKWGDYFHGSSSTVLYLDDFSLTY